MKKILLINPPPNDFHNGMSIMFPNGGILLLGELCREKGHIVNILEMVAENINIEELRHIVSSLRPDIVGISMNTFQVKWSKTIIKTIKSLGNMLVVVGGVHPTSVGKNIFKEIPEIDVSVIGEGEHSFLEIVEGRPLEEINGICYNGHQTLKREPITDFSYIPLPNLDFVDLSKFDGTSYWGCSGRSMYIMASRGCPYRCIFCNKSLFGYKLRVREPDTVIDEIGYLHKKYNINEIFFQDDILNQNREWVTTIFNLLIKSNLNKEMTFMVAFRANEKLVDDGLLRLAKEAGVRIIFYGVESGSQRILNNMKKDINVSEIKRAFKMTIDAGIETVASFIIGLPGEDEESIRETISLYEEINPSYADIAVATPFPSTKFEELISKNGCLLSSEYENYKYGGNYIRTEDLSTKQLDYFCSVISFGFHSHRWIFKLPIFLVGRSKYLYNLFNWIVKIFYIRVRRLL